MHRARYEKYCAATALAGRLQHQAELRSTMYRNTVTHASPHETFKAAVIGMVPSAGDGQMNRPVPAALRRPTCRLPDHLAACSGTRRIAGMRIAPQHQHLGK